MDAEKAFDKVSFTTVNKIFEHFDWPSRFRSLIKVIYSVDTVSARTVTNGCVSPFEIHINFGTRQGCPLFPLIFAIVAELLCQALLKDKQYKGASNIGDETKVLAYANDIAISIADEVDIVGRNYI